MKINISFTLPSLNIGGAESVCLTLLNSLSDNKYNLNLLLHKKQGGFLNDLSQNVTLYYLLPNFNSIIVNKILSVASLPILFVKVLVRAIRSDIMIAGLECTYITYLTILSCKILRKPVVIIIHNDISKNKEVLDTFHLKIIRLLYPLVSRCVCVSRGVLDGVVSLVPDIFDKIQVIYNPFDIEKIVLMGEETISISNKYIVSVGRLAKVKRHDLLIKAYSVLCSEGSELDMVIVGDGPLRNEIEKLIFDLNLVNRVHLIGFESNPYKWIKNANFIVSTSENEGFGNVLVEAMALNIPCISTNCPSGPYEIIGDSKFGILVENQNFNLITDAMRLMSNDVSTYEKYKTVSKQRAQFFSKYQALKHWDKLFNVLN